LCHSNLRFTFAAGTIKHQATGRQNAVVRETDYTLLATPLRSCSWQRTRLIGLVWKFVRKRTQRKSGRDKEMGCPHLQY
ncbi:MAG: hypothetical protein IJ219_08195, partial [Bacteroidaceae bacterium]|nr:hypothetical protein [Bacteroidaceae bacterium]